MNDALLSFAAETPEQLAHALHRVSIKVPKVTQGRTAQHRERYTMARFLATADAQGLLSYPLCVEHRDNTGKPDFILSLPNDKIGIECVEAVPQEWYEIQAIRERQYPHALNFGHRFKAGARTYTHAEKHAIASGESAGPPWMGNEPEQEWAEAHAHFISEKVAKLRNGNYEPHKRLWLLVQDEWRVPVTGVDDRVQAAQLLLPRVSELLNEPSFEQVFICSSPIMLTFRPGKLEVTPLINLLQ